jgi:glycerate 2-kinase
MEKIPVEKKVVILMDLVRKDILRIIDESINAVLPEEAVRRALNNKNFSEKIVIIAIGKAAWNMAFAAKNTLGDKINTGLVITKYDHSKGPIEGFEIIEAGHPIPDDNSVRGATRAIELVSKLDKNHKVVLLISGGGSALFEKPMEGVTLEDVIDISNKLLSCGADIVEINTVRKHLSEVKGGRFAKKCKDSSIYAIVLSDVIGDRLNSIASGPAYPDMSTSDEAFKIIKKYGLSISDSVKNVIMMETPKEIDNCETVVTANVSTLCRAARKTAQKLGYNTLVLTSTLNCEAKEAGRFMAAIARELKNGTFGIKSPCAIIAGGETVVRIVGIGKGGRNQELALSAAIGIDGLDDIVICSVGSDGTDGPTDAAGGVVDGKTAERIRNSGILPEVYIDNNDSYNALKESNDLILTGPTGTNVNDLIILLCK